jgi:hypothetical protein
MAFVKVYTTQNGDLATPLTTPVIVDMDFPINITAFTQAGGVGTNHTVADVKCTGLPTGFTKLQMDFGPASGTVADRLTQDQLINSLNNIMGEAVADPYAIPDYKQASRPAGYLEPETVYVIEDIKYIA